jgi:hypothetical protein
MGREAGAHFGGGPGVAAQACGVPADLHFAPLPAAADPDRAWIEEGLRRALARATMTELAALVALLAAESGTEDSLPGWLKTLVADEMDRRTDRPHPAPSGTGQDQPTLSNPRR